MAVLSLFPPGSALGADGMLTVGGCRADDLASEFGTPALVVADGALRARAQEYRGDVLIDEIALPDARVGDLLPVPATGAYCFTMASNYNGTRRIPVVFATDGAARLVVRRETWTDLLARDVE